MSRYKDEDDTWREHLSGTRLTWADVQTNLRKALSEPPAEHRIVGYRIVRPIQPVQMPSTPQPVSFLRWCGQPAVHSAHGRCDGVK